MASLLQSDAWIDQGIKDVDKQVHNHDHRATQQTHGLHHGKVAKGNALVEQPADAAPGDSGFPTRKSRKVTPSERSRPMPAQANTVSTTTATLIVRTRLMPASVSTGFSAF